MLLDFHIYTTTVCIAKRWERAAPSEPLIITWNKSTYRQKSTEAHYLHPSSSAGAARRAPLHPLNQQSRGSPRGEPRHLTGQTEGRTRLQGHLPPGRGGHPQRLRWRGGERRREEQRGEKERETGRRDVSSALIIQSSQRMDLQHIKPEQTQWPQHTAEVKGHF